MNKYARFPSQSEPPQQYPNSRAALQQSATRGHLHLLPIFSMLLVRPVLAFALQTLVAIFFLFLGDPQPWESAAPWWTVYGSVVDVISLFLLAAFLKNEGRSIKDLISYRPQTLPSDLALGAVLFIVYMVSTFLLQFGLAGILGLTPLQESLDPLPLLPALYSTLFWPALWAFSDQVIYNGYALPRLEVLFGSTGAAWLFTGTFWALGYISLPFLFDWQALIYQFLYMLPLTLGMVAVYSLIRRLVPLIFAQWTAFTFIVFITNLLTWFD